MLPSTGATMSRRLRTSSAARTCSPRSAMARWTSRSSPTTCSARWLARSIICRRVSPIACRDLAISPRNWPMRPSSSARARSSDRRRGMSSRPCSTRLRDVGDLVLDQPALVEGGALLRAAAPRSAIRAGRPARSGSAAARGGPRHVPRKCATARRAPWKPRRRRRQGSADRAGRRSRSAPSRSAVSRASSARSDLSWPLATFQLASAWVVSSRTSGWPSTTRSPSRTRMRLTMPPSRCWTVLRLLSTATTPGARAALDSGATAPQNPKPSRRTSTTAAPESSGRRRSGSAGGCPAAPGRPRIAALVMTLGSPGAVDEMQRPQSWRPVRQDLLAWPDTARCARARGAGPCRPGREWRAGG